MEPSSWLPSKALQQTLWLGVNEQPAAAVNGSTLLLNR